MEIGTLARRGIRVDYLDLVTMAAAQTAQLLAAITGRRGVEIGVGTGRIAVPLAAAGADTVAVADPVVVMTSRFQPRGPGR